MGFWIEQDEPDRHVQPRWESLVLREDGHFALVHRGPSGERVDTPLGGASQDERPER